MSVKYLDVEQLQAKRVALDKAEVEVSELEEGARQWVRGLTAYERIEILNNQLSGAERTVRLCAAGMLNPDGSQLFDLVTPEVLDLIGALDYEAITRIAEQVIDLTIPELIKLRKAQHEDGQGVELPLEDPDVEAAKKD